MKWWLVRKIRYTLNVTTYENLVVADYILSCRILGINTYIQKWHFYTHMQCLSTWYFSYQSKMMMTWKKMVPYYREMEVFLGSTQLFFKVKLKIFLKNMFRIKEIILLAGIYIIIVQLYWLCLADTTPFIICSTY